MVSLCVADSGPDSDGPERGSRSLTKFVNDHSHSAGKPRVDLQQGLTEDPLLHISQLFDTTKCNFVSSDRIWIPYPHITNNLRYASRSPCRINVREEGVWSLAKLKKSEWPRTRQRLLMDKWCMFIGLDDRGKVPEKVED